MNHSRKFRKLIAAVLSVLCIVLCCTACGGNSNKPTPRPQNTATDARTTDGMNTAEPGTDSPAGTDAPDSEKPTEDGSGQIADFREGKVVKPEDVPEIRSAVEKEYPGYTIQSVTHALLSDRQAYKVTLQGSGDLAKVIYMLADGTIVVPKMQD